MSQVYAPTSLIAGVRGTLLRYLGSAGPSMVGQIADVIPSNKESETHTWLGPAPQMQVVNDDDAVIYGDMSDTGYNLPNRVHVAGIKVKRTELDDQQYSAITRRINSLGRVAASYLNLLITNALINGTTQNGYDGVSFFNSAHPIRNKEPSTQSNIVSGSGTTTANLNTDIRTAMTRMMGFIDENGEPYDENLNRFVIACPSALYPSMLEAVQGDLLSNTSNILANSGQLAFRVIQSPRFTDANDWYMAADVDDDRPIVIQQRDPLEVSSNIDGDDAFEREEYKFKTRWRGIAGYAHWKRAIKVTNA